MIKTVKQRNDNLRIYKVEQTSHFIQLVNEFIYKMEVLLNEQDPLSKVNYKDDKILTAIQQYIYNTTNVTYREDRFTIRASRL